MNQFFRKIEKVQPLYLHGRGALEFENMLEKGGEGGMNDEK